MADFQNEMTKTVQGFVSQISELARRAAIDTLESAFNGPAGRRAPSAEAVPAVNGNRPGRPRGGSGRQRIWRH